MIILDTSAIIEILKNTYKAPSIKEHSENEEACITSFTVHELLVGVKEKELLMLTDFILSVRVLDFNIAAAFESSKIQKELASAGRTVEESDIFIAGICIANKAKLITLDKGFQDIRGLESIIL